MDVVKKHMAIKLPSGLSVGVDLWNVVHEPADPSLALRIARLVAEYQEARGEMMRIDEKITTIEKSERNEVAKMGDCAAAFRHNDELLSDDEARREREADARRDAMSAKKRAELRWTEYDSAMSNPARNNPAMKVSPTKPECPRPESIIVPDVTPVNADILRNALACADTLANKAPRMTAMIDELRNLAARRGELADKAAEIAGQMREAYREYKRAKDWDAQSAAMEAEDKMAIKEAREKSDAARAKLSADELRALGVVMA